MDRKNLRATPAARFLSREKNIDISLVDGSGPNGRIQKIDVKKYLDKNFFKISPLAKKICDDLKINAKDIFDSGIKGKIMKEDVLNFANNIKEETLEKSEVIFEEKQESNQGERRIPMSMMRRVVAKRMTESYFTAPVFVANISVDMTELLSLRKKILDQIMQEINMKITVTDLISLAVIKSLKKHPYINASFSKETNEIIIHDYVNLAMAVGLEDGLLTPVVKNADKLSLKELIVELKSLTKKAVEMKLEQDELEGSTFTISNLGMFGIDSFIPIINQPNSAILGVGATIEKPVVVNGEIVIKPMMNISVTVDHRIVDGMEGAKFLNTVKNYIENPLSLLV